MSEISRQTILDFKLRDDATFTNYIGTAAASLQQARGAAFVWGGAGSGKSHLLQAYCHATDDSIYLSNLTTLDTSILRGLESLALVCIDDVDQVVGKPKMQHPLAEERHHSSMDWPESLFHFINDCSDSGTMLVCSSAVPAAALNCKLMDLQTRLNSMIGIETDRLSDDEKLIALQRKATSHGFNFSDEVGRFILARAGRNMNSLFLMFEKISSETLREQRKVTIPFVKRILNL